MRPIAPFALAALATSAAALFGVAPLAARLATAYEGGALTLRIVSLVVAAVLASLPLLIDADDLLAHALDTIAAAVDDPARAALREGAALRRDADDALLDRETSRVAR